MKGYGNEESLKIILLKGRKKTLMLEYYIYEWEKRRLHVSSFILFTFKERRE